ncbi:hypothetical protein ILUMI_09666, partial [Ignelater luminosus]
NKEFSQKREYPEIFLIACSQRRCALCHQRTRIMCQYCKVGLHVHCWYEFHSK